MVARAAERAFVRRLLRPRSRFLRVGPARLHFPPQPGDVLRRSRCPMQSRRRVFARELPSCLLDRGPDPFSDRRVERVKREQLHVKSLEEDMTYLLVFRELLCSLGHGPSDDVAGLPPGIGAFSEADDEGHRRVLPMLQFGVTAK